MIDQERQEAEVGAHEHDVGRFDGEVGRALAQGDANGRGDKGRAVVDAVARHGRGAAIGAQLGDGGCLVFRQEFRPCVRQSDAGGDAAGRHPVVAGQQHRVDSLCGEPRHRPGRFGPDGVRERHHGPGFRANPADDDRPVGVRQLGQLARQLVVPQLLAGEPRAADPEVLAVHRGLGAASLDRREIRQVGRVDATVARVADYGAGERMLAPQLDGQQARQHVAFGSPADRPEFAHFRFALGDHAGLVECEGADARE